MGWSYIVWLAVQFSLRQCTLLLTPSIRYPFFPSLYALFTIETYKYQLGNVWSWLVYQQCQSWLITFPAQTLVYYAILTVLPGALESWYCEIEESSHNFAPVWLSQGQVRLVARLSCGNLLLGCGNHNSSWLHQPVVWPADSRQPWLWSHRYLDRL